MQKDTFVKINLFTVPKNLKGYEYDSRTTFPSTKSGENKTSSKSHSAENPNESYIFEKKGKNGIEKTLVEI